MNISYPEIEGNRDQKEDERTMKKLQEIGNSIHPSIQDTVDYPSNNPSGRMPVLDTDTGWKKSKRAMERRNASGPLPLRETHGKYPSNP